LFVPVRPYAIPRVVTPWGFDLSGTRAGAGGIGGLLARSRHATSSPYAVNGNSFYHADGNGNVTYLANSSGGTDAAYRYDPFGRWLAQTGPYASANVMRFSSKPWVAHNGSNTDGLYYYGYRFHDPLTQRWLNRDPITERGGLNLYRFARNNPINFYDLLGLKPQRCKEITAKDGTPLIYFDPTASDGGGWKTSRFDFISGGGSTLTFMDGFSVGWFAKVIVLCCCDDGSKMARQGTRIHSKTFKGPHDWFTVFEAGAMPINIPTAKTFLEAIGEAVAQVVDSNLPKPISIGSITANDIAGKIAANRPTKPTDGKWKNKSPCEE